MTHLKYLCVALIGLFMWPAGAWAHYTEEECGFMDPDRAKANLELLGEKEIFVGQSLTEGFELHVFFDEIEKTYTVYAVINGRVICGIDAGHGELKR